jgi:DnaJ-class molecular chaperone
MSEQEAYQTLGLRAGASAEEIIRTHRRLMKERHPDHGGTTDDAARINQAKDRLLRRHG